MKKTKLKTHLMCMDFETWIVLDKNPNKILSNKQRLLLDNKDTLKSLDHTLAILKKYNQKITFFVVFRLEELYPGVIKKILNHGHEVGWHSFSHPLLTNESILKKELKKSEKLLRKYQIKGFQAPSIVFFKKGYRLLKEYGFLYSSSIYGNSNEIYKFDGIYEIPVSTNKTNYLPQKEEIVFPSHMSLKNMKKFGLPFGSSYFWGILKKNYYDSKLKSASDTNRMINLFIHNWQLHSKSSTQLRLNDLTTLLKNPFYYPYTINVISLFEHLLKNYKFQKCIDYINSKK